MSSRLRTQRIALMAAGIIGILLVPLVAMQFTDQVSWQLSDFIVGGVLLAIAGVTYEFLGSRFPATGKRVAIGAVILLALILLWAELAVGLLGTPLAGS